MDCRLTDAAHESTTCMWLCREQCDPAGLPSVRLCASARACRGSVQGPVHVCSANPGPSLTLALHDGLLGRGPQALARAGWSCFFSLLAFTYEGHCIRHDVNVACGISKCDQGAEVRAKRTRRNQAVFDVHSQSWRLSQTHARAHLARI